MHKHDPLGLKIVVVGFAVKITLLLMAVPNNTHAVELQSHNIVQRELTLNLFAVSTKDIPERIVAKIDGKTIKNAHLEWKRHHLGLLIDTSASCKLLGLHLSLLPALRSLSIDLPSNSMVTVIRYNADIGIEQTGPHRIRDLEQIELICSSSRSLSVTDVFQRLAAKRTRFDLAAVFTSGNFKVESNSSQSIPTIANHTVVARYIPTKASELQLPDHFTFITRDPTKLLNNWLLEASKMIRQQIYFAATFSGTLPFMLRSGDYQVDLDLIRQGHVFTTKRIRLALPRNSNKSMSRSDAIRMTLLAFLLAIVVAVLLYRYYRTPTCKSCKRPILRATKKCLFCLSPSELILVCHQPSQNTPDVRVVGDHFTIGTQHSADFRLKHQASDLGVAIEKQQASYCLIPLAGSVSLNSEPCSNYRYLQDQDILKIGDMTCEIYARKCA